MEQPMRLQYALLYLIPLGTFWGNIFVCLAVCHERKLKHRFNIFLVSLAISDLLCAVLVMPVSAWQMITGRLNKNPTFCLVWYSMDIFFTATTIIHLCSVSLDRYLVLRRPFRRRSSLPKVCSSLVLRIFMSWFVPFSIAGPLFVFALSQQESEIYRDGEKQKQHNFNVTYQKVRTGTNASLLNTSYKGCGPNDPGFVLTAIGVTFVLPLIIMTSTYVLTVKSLQRHMKQVKTIKLHATNKQHAGLNTQLIELKREFSDRSRRAAKRCRTLTRSSSEEMRPKRIDQGGTEEKSDEDQCMSHQLRRQSRKSGDAKSKKEREAITPKDGFVDVYKYNGRTEYDAVMERERAGNKNKESNLKQLGIDRTDSSNSRTTCLEAGVLLQSSRVKVTPTQAIAVDRIHNGTRAVRVIGVLFGLFVTCYSPFFFVYTVNVVCDKCKDWTDPVIPHLEWLGYLSSMLNPVVYHSFNSIFRRTFRRMLYCICKSTHD